MPLDPVPFLTAQYRLHAPGRPDPRILLPIRGKPVVGRPQPRATPPSHGLRRIRAAATVLVVGAALTVLRGAAFASPPDPTTGPGIYDDADGDDVVGRVVETAACEGPVRVRLVPPVLSSEVVRMCAGRPYEGSSALHVSRGPPAEVFASPASWLLLTCNPSLSSFRIHEDSQSRLPISDVRRERSLGSADAGGIHRRPIRATGNRAI